MNAPEKAVALPNCGKIQRDRRLRWKQLPAGEAHQNLLIAEVMLISQA
jgi:hypothetical protein